MFEYYLYDEPTGEAQLCEVGLVSCDKEGYYCFSVKDSGRTRLVDTHDDPYNEYQSILSECKRLSEVWCEDVF